MIVSDGGAGASRAAVSPYRLALGDELDRLHPRLRAYFDAIPPGCHGYGRGMFDTLGSRRWWLRPLIAAVSRAHVMFPVWEHDVPFTVVNRPCVHPDGTVSVSAERTFEFAGGHRAMIDEISAEGTAIVDRLGLPVRIEARFQASVDDGGLRLASTATTLRAGRVRVRIPRFASPRVVLSECYDADDDVQRVAIAVDLPLIGRLYEYAGAFRYEIRKGERTA